MKQKFSSYSNSLDDARPAPILRGVTKRFGDLCVRSKLVILHNVFFAALAGGVFLAVEPALTTTRWALLAALGILYALTILLLELVLIPLYIYRPLRLILDADKATQRGDRSQELIPEESTTRDEMGRTVRSRNSTIVEMRKHEDYLVQALVRLEETVEDLTRKNHQMEAAHWNLANQDRPASLLDFARMHRAEMAPIAVWRLVEEAWGLIAIDERAARIQFLNRVAEEHRVLGNADRLHQVFVNLLRNAAHAVGSTGAVTASSSRVVVDGESWIEIAVEDDGPGISPDVLSNLFDAVVTTRLDARGAGVGLTVAEGIVHQHGGSIAASNRPGGGARLQVRLRETQQAAGE